MNRQNELFRKAERRAVSSLSSAIGSLAIAGFLSEHEGGLSEFVEDVASGKPNALRAMEALTSDIETLEAAARVLTILKAKVADEICRMRPHN